MTTFDDREKGFETKFALDQDQEFRAMARRNKLLGLWVAELLGKTGADAEAYALWAGKSLPTEAEWECAALTHPDFQWGEVWEWTASTFAPYPGFVAHAYADYSAPWFGTHQVLRGAAAGATSPHIMHPKYRNFFKPERTDIFVGFRSCV